MASADTIDIPARPRRIEAGASWLWRPAGFYTLAVLFAVTHWLLRPWLTATAGSDDTDQLLLSQVLQGGYSGEQQPLYTWLLWLVSRLIGPTILAAAFVKYGLVLLIHVFSYLAAGRLVDDPRVRFVAGFAPMLIYPLAWRLHEADTHGVLAAALSLALFWSVQRVMATRRGSDYALLGLLFGLALLTSLAFVAGIAALFIGARFVPGTRAAFTEPRAFAALAFGLLVFLPHLWWMVEHWPGVVREFDIYLRGIMRRDYLGRLPSGLRDWYFGLFLWMFPLWLIVPLLFPQLRHRIGERGDPRDAAARLVPPVLGITALLLLAAVIGFGIEDLPQYRVYFLFMPLIPYLFWRIDRNGVDPRQIRWILMFVATVFVMVVQLRIQQIYVGPAYCKTCRLQAPYPVIAAQMREGGFGGAGLIMADDEYVAGNMRVQFPGSVVNSARYPLFAPPMPVGPVQCVLVWSADEYDRMPNRLREMVANRLGVRLTGGEPDITILTAMVPHSDTAIAPLREIHIGTYALHGADGRCA